MRDVEEMILNALLVGYFAALTDVLLFFIDCFSCELLLTC